MTFESSPRQARAAMISSIRRTSLPAGEHGAVDIRPVTVGSPATTWRTPRAPTRHEPQKFLRRQIAHLLEVRVDARQRRPRVDAEHRIVVHAEHGQVVGHMQATACTGLQDEIRRVVVCGEDARRLRQGLQPGRKSTGIRLRFALEDPDGVALLPPQFAREDRPATARPDAGRRKADEAVHDIVAGLRQRLGGEFANPLGIDVEERAAVQFLSSERLLRPVQPDQRNLPSLTEAKALAQQGDVAPVFIEATDRATDRPGDGSRQALPKLLNVQCLPALASHLLTAFAMG